MEADKKSERAAPSARAPLPVPPDGLQLGKDSCKGRINTQRY